MLLENSFKDNIVLVTGGGSGIGYAIAKQYLQNGAKVIISGRNTEKLAKAKEELNKIGELHTHICDIRKPDEITVLSDYIKTTFGNLDILVNNAGGQFPASAENISVNGWTAVVNNNLNGTFYITREMATRFFIPQNSGNILNIIANIYRGFPGMAHTGAARAGVDNLTKTLAVEWSKYKIRVNAIAPGIIKSTGLEQYPPELLKGVTDTIPLRELGSTDDIANATLFITSPYAKFITGATLNIDGGQSLYGEVFKL